MPSKPTLNPGQILKAVTLPASAMHPFLTPSGKVLSFEEPPTSREDVGAVYCLPQRLSEHQPGSVQPDLSSVTSSGSRKAVESGGLG